MTSFDSRARNVISRHLSQKNAHEYSVGSVIEDVDHIILRFYHSAHCLISTTLPRYHAEETKSKL